MTSVDQLKQHIPIISKLWVYIKEISHIYESNLCN